MVMSSVQSPQFQHILNSLPPVYICASVSDTALTLPVGDHPCCSSFVLIPNPNSYLRVALYSSYVQSVLVFLRDNQVYLVTSQISLARLTCFIILVSVALPTSSPFEWFHVKSTNFLGKNTLTNKDEFLMILTKFKTQYLWCFCTKKAHLYTILKYLDTYFLS